MCQLQCAHNVTTTSNFDSVLTAFKEFLQRAHGAHTAHIERSHGVLTTPTQRSYGALRVYVVLLTGRFLATPYFDIFTFWRI